MDKKQEASEIIALKLKEVDKLLSEVSDIANEAGVHFHWDGPQYGMGGSYFPKWEDSSDNEWGEESGWMSSSSNC